MHDSLKSFIKDASPKLWLGQEILKDLFFRLKFGSFLLDIGKSNQIFDEFATCTKR